MRNQWGAAMSAQDPSAYRWSKAPPQRGHWYFEWSGDENDAPEMVLIALEFGTDPVLKGWYRGRREKEPLMGGPFWAGPILAPMPSTRED